MDLHPFINNNGGISYVNVLSIITDTTMHAGYIIKDCMSGTSSNQYREQNKLKGGWDPVTSCDILTQHYITTKLKTVLPPTLQVRGEENESGAFYKEIIEQHTDTLRDVDSKPQINLFDELHTLLPPALQYLDIEHTAIWIDPLDGTREFVRKDYRAVTILIGISYFDHAIAGIILAPYEDGPIICGGYGIGVFTNVPVIAPIHSSSFLSVMLPLLQHFVNSGSEAIPTHLQQSAAASITLVENNLQPDNFETYFSRYSDACETIQKKIFTICKRFHTYIPTQTRDKVVYITSSSRSSEPFNAFLQQCKYDGIIFVGGAGYKAILVLVGSANVYTFPLPGTKKWDTCAIQAILETHGACFTDATGNPILYSTTETTNNSYGILVTMDSTNTIARPTIDVESFRQLHSLSL